MVSEAEDIYVSKKIETYGSITSACHVKSFYKGLENIVVGTDLGQIIVLPT